MKIQMIDPAFIATYAERHKQLSAANAPNVKPKAMRKVKCDDDEVTGISGEARVYEVEAPEYGLAIYDVCGMITKDEYWYYNMCDLMDDMTENEADESILSHVICMDSGGGEATNIETVTRFIRDVVKKPVLVHINGFACSAAYYLATGADKIYTSEGTDIVGSIGTVITIDDYARWISAMGIDRHEIYATASTEKNEDYKLVLQGKYDAIKANLLDPYTAQFVKTVSEMRTITDDGHVFAGKTYMTEAAQAIGLIDGQMTFEAVLDEAIQLGTQFFHQNKIQMTTINMSAPRIAAVLGISTDQFVAQDGHVSVRAEDFAAIEVALLTPAAAVVEPAAAPVAIDPAIAELRAALDTVKVEAAEKLAAMNNQLEQFKQQVSAGPIAVPRGEATDTAPGADAKAAIIEAERKMFG